MGFGVLLHTALSALRPNVSRSLLTMLGIVIGVFAVIASMAVGAGARATVLKQIDSLGANRITITPGSTTSGAVRLGNGSRITLRLADADAIAANVPEVGGVAPYSESPNQAIAGANNWYTMIGGTTPGWLSVGNWSVAQGIFFADRDLGGATKVAVLGNSAAANLFPGGGAVGSVVIVNNIPFRVLGVLAAKGHTEGPRDPDDVVVIPITTYQERVMGQTWINAIMISAGAPDTVPEVIDASERLLRLEHRLTAVEPDDFTIHNDASVQQVRMATARTRAVLLSAVAVLSLVVGGIGIMNIMLVSVSERTREIGLRMAVGARGRDILLQFLIEALVIAGAGGGIGIGLAVVVTFLASMLANWPTVISAFSVFLGLASAVTTGVVFGFYPARRAAALDPIDALRHE